MKALQSRNSVTDRLQSRWSFNDSHSLLFPFMAAAGNNDDGSPPNWCLLYLVNWQQLTTKHLSWHGQPQCTPEDNNGKEVRLGSDFSPRQASKQSSNAALHGSNFPAVDGETEREWSFFAMTIVTVGKALDGWDLLMAARWRAPAVVTSDKDLYFASGLSTLQPNHLRIFFGQQDDSFATLRRWFTCSDSFPMVAIVPLVWI